MPKDKKFEKWERDGEFTRYFDYQHEPHTGIRNTQNYAYMQWGKVEHRFDGKFLQVRGFNPTIPGVTREWLIEVYKDELKDVFTAAELDQLGNKDAPILGQLLQQWRDSFDLAVYDDPYYAFETVSCGINVTGMMQKSVLSYKSPILHTLMWWSHLGYKPETLVDVGPGIGLSSVWFAHHLPGTQVYVDELNSTSVRLIERVKKELKLDNLHIGDKLESYDAGTFFEVVEHIQSDSDKRRGNPYPWLDKYLSRIRQNFVYSTYWTKNETSVGHFDTYDFGGGPVASPRKWGKAFRGSMEERSWAYDNRHQFYGGLPHFFWRGSLQQRPPSEK